MSASGSSLRTTKTAWPAPPPARPRSRCCRPTTREPRRMKVMMRSRLMRRILILEPWNWPLIFLGYYSNVSPHVYTYRIYTQTVGTTVWRDIQEEHVSSFLSLRTLGFGCGGGSVINSVCLWICLSQKPMQDHQTCHRNVPTVSPGNPFIIMILLCSARIPCCGHPPFYIREG